MPRRSSLWLWSGCRLCRRCRGRPARRPPSPPACAGTSPPATTRVVVVEESAEKLARAVRFSPSPGEADIRASRRCYCVRSTCPTIREDLPAKQGVVSGYGPPRSRTPGFHDESETTD